MTVELTVVELTLLVEALDEYIESKTDALLARDGTIPIGDEAKLAILDGLVDALAGRLYGDDASDGGFDD